MKIVFIFDSTYPNYTGGIETWIYNVCERLIEKHDVTIFTVENYRKDNQMGKFTNINPAIKIIPVKNLNHLKFIKPFVRSYIAVYNSNITVYSMRQRIKKELDLKEKYYFIALGTVFAAKTARLLKKDFKNSVAIASCRSLHPEVLGELYPGIGKIASKMEKKNLRVMDAIWTNGIDTQTSLRNKGFDSTVIKNGVNFKINDEMEAYDYQKINLKDEIKIVTIGTVQKIKGYYEIIDAVSWLKKLYGVEAHLIGVGKGNLELFNHYAEKKEVRNQIHLLGEQRNVVQYAKGADVIACAGGGGGYGMAIIESMVSQTPIVAWDSPAYRQLLKDGYSAKLVKSWDAKELAKGIYYVLTHKDEAEQWGKNARKEANNFDWSEVINEIEDALEKL